MDRAVARSWMKRTRRGSALADSAARCGGIQAACSNRADPLASGRRDDPLRHDLAGRHLDENDHPGRALVEKMTHERVEGVPVGHLACNDTEHGQLSMMPMLDSANRRCDLGGGRQGRGRIHSARVAAERAGPKYPRVGERTGTDVPVPFVTYHKPHCARHLHPAGRRRASRRGALICVPKSLP